MVRKCAWAKDMNPIRIRAGSSGYRGNSHGDRANRITKIELNRIDARATSPLLKLNPIEAMTTEEINPPTPVADNRKPPTSAFWRRTSAVNTGRRNHA